jgi:hypothetical protein
MEGTATPVGPGGSEGAGYQSVGDKDIKGTKGRCEKSRCEALEVAL